MDLTAALNELGNFYNLNPAHLIGYADEDNIGGFHFDESLRTYHTGSIWGVEGQVLYALIRAMKPDRVANLGTGVGCSLHHMALACHENGHGMVYSVDNGAGEEIRHLDKSRTSRLKAHIHFESADMVAWLADEPDNSYDLIFEDWSHDPVAIAEVWKLAQRKLKPGGLMISHDSEHFIVGAQVLEGVVNSHVPPFGILRQLIEPSDCGLIYWQRDYGNEPLPDYIMSRGKPSDIALEEAAQAFDEMHEEYEAEFDHTQVRDFEGWNEAGVTKDSLTVYRSVSFHDREGTTDEVRADNIERLTSELESMDKDELAEWALEHRGIKLDKRKSPENMIADILDSEGYGEE